MKSCRRFRSAVAWGLELLLDIGAGASGAKSRVDLGNGGFVCRMELKDELAAICDERGWQPNCHGVGWWLAALYDLSGLCGAGEEQLAKLGVGGFLGGPTGVGGEGEG